MNDNHKEALWRLNKIVEDAENSKNAINNEDFNTAFNFYNRIRETVRLIQDEGNLKQSDTDASERERIGKDLK